MMKHRNETGNKIKGTVQEVMTWQRRKVGLSPPATSVKLTINVLMILPATRYRDLIYRSESDMNKY